MTKTAGIEGTGIIACDYEEELREVLSGEELEHAKSLLSKVSVVKDGIIAGRIGTHGMHDVTEGGILGAVWEMCSIAGTGARLDAEAIPADDVTRRICEHYDINMLRLISSGSMLIMTEEDKKEEIIRELAAQGIPAAQIGKIVPKEEGLSICEGGKQTQIDPPGPDELYKIVK